MWWITPEGLLSSSKSAFLKLKIYCWFLVRAARIVMFTSKAITLVRRDTNLFTIRNLMLTVHCAKTLSKRDPNSHSYGLDIQ